MNGPTESSICSKIPMHTQIHSLKIVLPSPEIQEQDTRHRHTPTHRHVRAFIYSLINHAFHRYFFSDCYVSVTIQDFGITTMKKVGKKNIPLAF
jgi:hypothetical protein